MDNDYDYFSQALQTEIERIRSLVVQNDLQKDSLIWIAKNPVFEFERLVKEVIVASPKFSAEYDTSMSIVIDMIEQIVNEDIIIMIDDNQTFKVTERGLVILEYLSRPRF